MSLENRIMKFIFVFILLASYFVDSTIGGEFQFPGKEDGKIINVFDFLEKENVIFKK